MLGTMRRREDELLAISPPPEFQDLQISPSASTSSVTPPQDFRDLTPSPSCPDRGALFSSLSNECNKVVREFAEKISFNILNEAMIIATLIPQAGVSVTDFRSHHLSVPSSGGKFSSDSYDSSSATSWEYLHEVEDLSSFIRPNLPSPIPLFNYPLPTLSGKRYQKRTLRKSNSESIALGMAATGKIRPTSHCQSRVPNMASQQFKRNSLLSPDEQTNDVLTKDNSSRTISDCYTVPFECDIYSLPVDNIPNPKDGSSTVTLFPTSSRYLRSRSHRDKEQANSRLSLREEPTGGAATSGWTSEAASRGIKMRNSQRQKNGLADAIENSENSRTHGLSERNNNEEHGRTRKKRRSKSIETENQGNQNGKSSQALTKTGVESTEKEKRTLGSSFLNLFRRSRPKTIHLLTELNSEESSSEAAHPGRALPVPPMIPQGENGQSPPHEVENLVLRTHSTLEPRDFAARIEKVKDCGWYWGPLSSKGAEDLLRGEPDGSFIVRDSSDVHYIFSLTFKLNGLIRHVRIEHDQGNFSFGPLTRFKAATIVDFVEKAVAHSRSGRYLFFLHRRPILGPMRVQLLHPYSRFIHPRSLQHMCRFVILKHVRRDLVNSLPLPNPLLDYLNTPQYYFENKLEVS